MNKVITINLNGNAFPLEEDGYEALRSYLDTAAQRLDGNPDKDEIIRDIEQAIAEKFRAILNAYKTVVVTKEVESVIAEMGPVQDPSTPTGEPSSTGSDAHAAEGHAGPEESQPPKAEDPTARPPRRLHKIKDGAMIGGVCNGLAAYFGIDVTLVRIAFVLLLLVYGTGVLMYILMMIIFPEAVTPAEKAAAFGGAHTAQEFIRRAKAGYYEGTKTFTDKKARREWKRKFKDEMRGWKRDFKREMRENAPQWGRPWSQPPQHGLAAWIVFPFLLIARVLLAVLGICAVISLICTGAVFGLFLPFYAPLWVGIIFLIIVYKILVWSFKAMHQAYYFPGPYGSRHFSPFFGMTESVLWLGLLVLILWVFGHHRYQVHEILHNLPHVIRHAADSVRDWWDDR